LLVHFTKLSVIEHNAEGYYRLRLPRGQHDDHTIGFLLGLLAQYKKQSHDDPNVKFEEF